MAKRKTCTSGTSSTITTFNKETLNVLREKIDSALAVVGEECGLKFALGRITYSSFDNTAQAKLEFETTKNAKGEVIDRDRDAWMTYAQGYGLKPEWFGKTFDNRGKQYRITGLEPSKKYCVKTVCVTDGKKSSWTVSAVLGMFDPEAAAKQNEARVKEVIRWAHSEWGWTSLDQYGLQKEWLDKVFKVGQPNRMGMSEFKVEGFDSSRRSTPVVISFQKDGVTEIAYAPTEYVVLVAGGTIPAPKTAVDYGVIDLGGSTQAA